MLHNLYLSVEKGEIAKRVFNLLKRATVLKDSNPLALVQLRTSEFSIFIQGDLGFGLRGSKLTGEEIALDSGGKFLITCCTF